MANFIAAFGHALWMAFAMFWEILWPLILGFGLSGAVQAVVSKGEMSKLLPNDSPKSLAVACGLGAALSSCSYAAVALARSIFRKGADFTAAMAFELASTNLVAGLAICPCRIYRRTIDGGNDGRAFSNFYVEETRERSARAGR